MSFRHVAAATLGVLIAAAPAAQAFDPATEAQNFSKIEERQTIYNTAQYQTQLRQVGVANATEAATMQATDPERNFLGLHLCSTGDDGCAGDARLYDWEANGYGIVKKVLFTARSGATSSLSGPPDSLTSWSSMRAGMTPVSTPWNPRK